MSIKRKRYQCTVASKPVVWAVHLEPISGIGSDEPVEYVETRRWCENEKECSIQGLFSGCPMRCSV